MKQLIKPQKLNKGDEIGIISPSYLLKPEHVQSSIQKLQEIGFKVKLSKHIYSDTNGYAGSVEERAYDFNAMVADDNVKMLLFGGGEVCNEILPYIDYENIAKHPKIICSYSDSTTILNAVHDQTGLVTFYGASIGTFDDLSAYNWDSFEKRLMMNSLSHIQESSWKTIVQGSCKGILTGGYLVNYAAMQGLQYFNLDKTKTYLLFIEDHEMFNSPAVVSKWFSTLEQHGIFQNVSGLIFGHYSNKEQPLIDDILYRIGHKYDIPVARCEDFGHGKSNSIFPIGISAKLDASKGEFEFCESGVV